LADTPGVAEDYDSSAVIGLPAHISEQGLLAHQEAEDSSIPNRQQQRFNVRTIERWRLELAKSDRQ